MEELFFVYAAIVEEKESRGRRKILKVLRDKSDPFTMQDTTFTNTFRFPKSLCKILIGELVPHDVQKSSISFDLRFLTCLYFYGFYTKFGMKGTIGPYWDCFTLKHRRHYSSLTLHEPERILEP